ncbi:MAG: hypothetical protein QOD07_980 [Frankiaceae bacterium]|jgi:hypothetical protein|nr:hypothetical protein [Frankiaceae bacterium]
MVSGTPIEQQLAHVAERLSAEYRDKVGPGVVRELFEQARSSYRQARVTQFVPILVDRSVRQQLRSVERQAH